MGSLCLSSVSILRCAPLTRVENMVLIIPPALEIIFSTSLVFTNWGKGWRHLFLTFDSWSYLFLALVDLFSHIIPAVRDDLNAFSTSDLIIGAATFIPILFYTVFIFLFARAELLGVLPSRFRNIAQFMLVIFIPAIVGLNEVASLVGISRISQNNQLFIGFKEDRDRTLWTFFTSLTLALITTYQAISFSFAFMRLVQSFLNQRDLEAASSDEAYLFRGTGWIAGGLKLGAIETVIGFADAGFGGAITRRVLRMISRACLCIGVVKGLDTVENFGQFQQMAAKNSLGSPGSTRQRRISHPRLLISNPRLSTFRQLSPTATEFHTTPPVRPLGAAKDRGIGPRSTVGLNGLAEFADLRKNFKASRRVTIHFAEGAPRLQMRFSALNFPSPATFAQTVESRPHTDEMSERLSQYQRSTLNTRMSKSTHSCACSTMTEDSLHAAVRDLTPHFPRLPAKALITGSRSWTTSPEPVTLDDHSRAPIRTRLSQLMSVDEMEEDSQSHISLPGNATVERRPTTKYHVPSYMNTKGRSENRTSVSAVTNGRTSEDQQTTRQTTPATDENPFKFDDDSYRGARTDSGIVVDDSNMRKGQLRHVSSQWLESTNSGIVERYRQPSAVSFLSSPAYNISLVGPHLTHGPTRTVSWVQSPYDDSVVTPRDSGAPEVRDPIAHAMSMNHRKTGSLTRIKTVGKAPRKITPSPSSNLAHHVRGSVHLEHIMIPPKAHGMVNVQAVQGSDAGSIYSTSPSRNMQFD